jgi:F-type H+-transporting ATPase subunit 8
MGQYHIKYDMPQLLPFYFVNQYVFAMVALFTITYVMSVYVLPYFVHLFVTRVYITKL